jgi:hypothetical protein
MILARYRVIARVAISFLLVERVQMRARARNYSIGE